MLEVTSEDILKLSDSELRMLVARLAIAELKSQGCPASAVTAGGNQDAPDGGIDVRVQCPVEMPQPDFVPRKATGFQVKKPDMPASKIEKEMRPNGTLRDAICELVDDSGAYIIVSAQGSLSDRPLRTRKEAIRNALRDLQNASQLHTDFYDRDRLATWINQFPGLVAWIRLIVGRPLSGWSGIFDWNPQNTEQNTPYLISDKACLVDERTGEFRQLKIVEGITELRDLLRIPSKCVRLVGLSGLGKTRLVQALFEDGITDNPLDSNIALYTDYSEDTSPTAREMARNLLAQDQRAILVVDNCNPKTHTELAHLCSVAASKVSLITVEYDVQEDELEETDVFRLMSVSPELVAEWIKQNYSNVSQLDRDKIAEFSDGNFRVARMIARTLAKNETLGSLRNRVLFERIFQQRNDPDQLLLRAAEELSLLYSIDGEDVSEDGELAKIAQIRNIDPKVLFEALVKMKDRGIVQARGRFRAILPQAIANPLAAQALKRIPTVTFDQFSECLSPRMLKSLAHRIGYLHDSTAAQSVVLRWLSDNGLLANFKKLNKLGRDLLIFIAPVAPQFVLDKILRELQITENKNGLFEDGDTCSLCKKLLKSLSYETELFERGAYGLALLIAKTSNPIYNDSRNDAFGEMFQIQLSGTQASPEQRRNLIRYLAKSEDPDIKRMASIALERNLKADHFSSWGNFDFGARSRDWGWRPKTNGEVWDWFTKSIELTIELDPVLPDAKQILARSIRSLWRIESIRDVIINASKIFGRDNLWIDGWIALRATYRYDVKDDDEKELVLELLDELKPNNLLDRARAIVLNRISGGWDFADGEDDEDTPVKAWHKAERLAFNIGRELAYDEEARSIFLPELIANHQHERAYQCGQGMAEATGELSKLWKELATVYANKATTNRNATALGGYLEVAYKRDAAIVNRALDAAFSEENLYSIVSYLQARVGVDGLGIDRLCVVLEEGKIEAKDLYPIAGPVVEKMSATDIVRLLSTLSKIKNGPGKALEILYWYLSMKSEKGNEVNEEALVAGRNLLTITNYGKFEDMRDFHVGGVIRFCLLGPENGEAAASVCERLVSSVGKIYFPAHNLQHVIEALLEVQPFAALDAFLLSKDGSSEVPIITRDSFENSTPLERLDLAILVEWAEMDSEIRYPRLGLSIRMFDTFKEENNEKVIISSLFLSLLERAPNKAKFLGNTWDRIHPNGWSGSLADVLEKRLKALQGLVENADAETQNWITSAKPEIDEWINDERKQERMQEESFE